MLFVRKTPIRDCSFSFSRTPPGRGFADHPGGEALWLNAIGLPRTDFLDGQP